MDLNRVPLNSPTSDVCGRCGCTRNSHSSDGCLLHGCLDFTLATPEPPPNVVRARLGDVWLMTAQELLRRLPTPRRQDRELMRDIDEHIDKARAAFLAIEIGDE